MRPKLQLMTSPNLVPVRKIFPQPSILLLSSPEQPQGQTMVLDDLVNGLEDSPTQSILSVTRARIATQKSSRSRNFAVQFSDFVRLDDNKSQRFTKPWNSVNSNDDFSSIDDHDDESQPERHVNECTTAKDKTSMPSPTVDEITTINRQHQTVPLSGPELSNAKPLSCRGNVLFQADDLNIVDDGDKVSYRGKYFKLLKNYNNLSEAHKALKRKYEKQNQSIAELKDLVVFANTETKKASKCEIG